MGRSKIIFGIVWSLFFVLSCHPDSSQFFSCMPMLEIHIKHVLLFLSGTPFLTFKTFEETRGESYRGM